jgi:penicillin-binding protein 1C
VIGAAAWLQLLALLTAPAVPVPAEVRAAYRPSEVRLLDRHGEVVHELRVDDTRRRLPWTPLVEISPALRAAVLASEDRRFHGHHGVDYRALAGAAVARLTGGPRRGASTVTMQLAAQLDPELRRRGGPRTLGQKWRQIRWAWALEARWTKAEILEAYLNLITFRGELQGVAAAAHVLFGKVPHGLTEPEALVLAALLRAPNAGADLVLRRAWRLREAGGARVGPAALAAAARRALAAPRGLGPRVALASHAAARLLPPGARRGVAGPIATTLDAALQRLAAESLQRQLLAVRDENVDDGAVLVVDNATGEVLAYVGGSGALSSASFVDGVRARRQPGSTLKPFLYGLAFERRLLTAATLLDDSPVDLPAAGGLYRPKNYDNRFRGLVTARTALASSLNVPAVKVLELVGTERFVDRLRALGMEALTEAGDYYGPALALGGADVSLWELVDAYRTLASGGVWSPLALTPGASAGPRRRVFAPEIAFLVAHVLSDRESRSTTFGLENALATPFWTAVKTGTSKDMRDNWCVGFSARYTVGVWVGNFSGAPMHDVSGITGAAPVWLELMTWLHRARPSAPPAPPRGVVAREVEFPRGVEPARREWFVAGTEPLAPATTLAAPRPRIVSPVPGTIVALDPDIPPAQQRLVFTAEGGGGPLRWLLNGQPIDATGDRVLWPPARGRYTLSLADADAILDTVAFEVR